MQRDHGTLGFMITGILVAVAFLLLGVFVFAYLQKA